MKYKYEINLFKKYLSRSNGFANFKQKQGLNRFKVKNKKAINRSRSNTSSLLVFPFKNFIEENTGVEIPEEQFNVSISDIEERDRIAEKKFSTPNLDYSKINLDRLIKATHIVTDHMGFSEYRKLELLSPLESARRFPNNTSSAYPVYKPKQDEASRNEAISFAESYLTNRKPSLLFSRPVTIFHRFQAKNSNVSKSTYTVRDFRNQVRVYKDSLSPFNNKKKSNFKFNIDTKIRQVYALPYSVQTLEGCFFRNLVDQYIYYSSTNSNPVTPTGRSLPRISDTVMTDLRNKAKLSNSKLLSIDLESFDANVPPFMIALFGVTMKKFINFPDENSSRAFDDLINYYINTPYIKTYRSDKVDFSKGIPLKFQCQGLPSGSLVTNFMGTFINSTILVYSHLENNEGLSGSEIVSCFTVLGDDNLIVLNYLSENKIINVFSRFGFSVNANKSELVNNSSKIPFLGYVWDTTNRPIQSIPWYIVHLIFPSRFIRRSEIPFDIKYLQTFRAISLCCQLYDGFKIYKQLVGNKDRVLNEFYRMYVRGQDPLLHVVLEDQRNFLYRFPFSLILKGWRAFGGMLSDSVNESSKIIS